MSEFIKKLTVSELSFPKLWIVTVLGIPLWWFFGLNLGIYHLIAAVLFFQVVVEKTRRSQGVLIPTTVYGVGALFFIYLSTILIHAGSGDASRLIAAFYNLSFWFMGILLLIALANRPLIGQRALGISFWTLGVITAFLTIGIWMLWHSGHSSLAFLTPLHGLSDRFGRSSLIENSVIAKPLIKDWFASAARPRLNLYSPYPTAAGGILMLIIMALLTFAQKSKSLSVKALGYILIGFNLFALLMTLSRITVLALVCAYLVVGFLAQRRISLSFFLFLGILLAVAPFANDLLGLFLSLREGSNTTRMDIYMTSLHQLENVDWILGLGLKPREGPLDYPLGSHSTIIGLIYKTGIAGLTCFVFLQALILFRWYNAKKSFMQNPEDFALWRFFGMAFIGMILWMFTEDIDAPQTLSFLYFSLIGIFEGIRRRLQTHGSL